eukprot:TRINITY_DN45640_c0_g1_i1.p1 TRINITY_DN45640_c0_g1~~TRINITY_DN45640_c0_g1_i1.p1  ORF type:complete len:425 (-),score=121.01 TRINITY_DN45640_c0_g1_i1:97-1371(-)
MRTAIILAATTCLATGELYCGEDDCYSVLGLKRGASADAVNKAFTKLSERWNPGTGSKRKEEKTVKFLRIVKAHWVLSDVSIRSAYDYFLDHHEEHMYNTIRYYSAAYLPTASSWMMFFCFCVVLSGIQYLHFVDREKSFLKSPKLSEILEEEYINNCKRGRQGYQSGELTDEDKSAIKEELLKSLAANKHVPYSPARWSNTLIPCLVYHWPRAIVRCCLRQGEAEEEMDPEAEEERIAEEEEAKEEEERERMLAEKAKQKAEKAAYVAAKQKAEEEKRRKWAEEAEDDEDEEEEDEDDKPLTVSGKIASISELRKKGHLLVEVTYGSDESVQLVVVDRQLTIGQNATVALEGATLPDGKKAKRSKVAGEWNEGVLLELGKGSASKVQAAEEEQAQAAPEAHVEDGGEAEETKGEKSKPRKRKK